MQHTHVRRQSVSHQLADLLSQEIQTKYSTGQKLPPLRSLAKRFDVSPTTMSQALFLLVREGRIQAKHGSGFYVRQHDDKRHVGVLLDLDISVPEISLFWRRVVQQVRLGLRAHGYRTRFYAGHFRPSDYPPDEEPKSPPCADLMEDVAEDRLCGLVAVWGAAAPEWRDQLRQRQVPCIGSFGGFDAGVALDYEQAVREATRRLLQAGRRKLAFMVWSPAGDHLRVRDRLLDVFAAELARQGVTLNEHWVRRDIHPALHGAGWAAFREIWTASADKPDGLLIMDDILFHTAATAIQKLGIRVPDQLMVVTHANKGADYQYPFPVWQMEADPDAYARAQVELMVALLRRQPVAQPQVVLRLQFIEPEELSPVAADTKKITESIATKE